MNAPDLDPKAVEVRARVRQGAEVVRPGPTAGPWHCCDRGDYSDFDGDSRVIIVRDRGCEMRIAVVHDNGDLALCGEANARLIAAAPELRDALIELLAAEEMIGQRGYWKRVSAKERARDVLARLDGGGK